MIELQHISRTYAGPPPVAALKSCSLRIQAGEHVAITGPSGSGKSTLLNILGLLDSPSAGSYRFDGVDVAALPERGRTQLRGHSIGFVFQSFHLLLHRPAVDSVMLPMIYAGVSRRQRRRMALEALDVVGLADRSHAPPSTLSGGEQQRVAIARAIVNRPPLLLCDEPTGNLDSRNSGAILDLLDALVVANHTVVVITHDDEVARRAHRRVEVLDGVVRSALFQA